MDGFSAKPPTAERPLRRAGTRAAATCRFEAYCGLLRLIAAYCGLLRLIAARSHTHTRRARTHTRTHAHTHTHTRRAASGRPRHTHAHAHAHTHTDTHIHRMLDAPACVSVCVCVCVRVCVSRALPRAAREGLATTGPGERRACLSLVCLCAEAHQRHTGRDTPAETHRRARGPRHKAPTRGPCPLGNAGRLATRPPCGRKALACSAPRASQRLLMCGPKKLWKRLDSPEQSV